MFIDPKLAYSAYVGGTGSDKGYKMGVAVDGTGNAYITGPTTSSDFPMVNPYGDTSNGFDVFVAKFSMGRGTL